MPTRVPLMLGVVLLTATAACTSSSTTAPPISAGSGTSALPAGDGGVAIAGGANNSAACKLLTVAEVEQALKRKVSAIEAFALPGKYSAHADSCRWTVGDDGAGQVQAVGVTLERAIDLAAAKKEMADNASNGVGSSAPGPGDAAIDYGGPIEVIKGSAWVRIDVEVGDLKVDDAAAAALAPIVVGRL